MTTKFYQTCNESHEEDIGYLYCEVVDHYTNDQLFWCVG
jgi:hypothetical protein